MPRRTHHLLANGLSLVTTPQPQLHGVCIALAIRCGARDDTSRKWGLSHFVEHMMFRGSARYADSAALIAPFEQGGGTLNAETWRDHTLFWAVVHPKAVEGAMAALADMMIRPRFDDVELERSLVQAELACDIDEDGQDTDIGAVSRSNIWGPHPMGRRIVGSPETLLGLTVHDVRQRHKKAYVARNMALSIAGRISAHQGRTLAERYFSELPQGEPLATGRPPRFRSSKTSIALDLYPQPVSQLTVQLTFGALPDGHKDFTALSLLVALLDDGMGTRLHRALSERSGLVYAFQTGLDCYGDCGLYDIEMQVAPHRLQAAVAQTVAVLRDVALGDVGEAELQLAKERALMAVELGQDSAEDMAQEAAVDVLFHRPAPGHHAAAIRKTSCADVARLARDMFFLAPKRATLMGATQDVNHKAVLVTIEHALGHRMPSAITQTRAQPCSDQHVLAARRTRAGRYTKAKPQR